jgi:hypothetical protein
LIYRAFAEIARHTYSALIEAHPFYSERLLGREVMNALEEFFVSFSFLLIKLFFSFPKRKEKFG